MIEIDAEELKNDMVCRGVTESAVRFAPPDELKDYDEGAITEVEDM